ncbi:VOC family protein [Bacillus cereus]|nr:VOC family protein [Bacillus cereus]MDA2307626.1 VOC family protein [Bacillus cereus]
MIKYRGIDHITVNIRDLEVSRKFYTKVLGLEEIKRPNFDFEGAWYQVSDTKQTIHLVQHEGQTIRKGGFAILDGHFALQIHSYEDTINWLDKCGVFYVAFPKPQAGYPQIFVMDPDDNIIELNGNVI